MVRLIEAFNDCSGVSGMGQYLTPLSCPPRQISGAVVESGIHVANQIPERGTIDWNSLNRESRSLMTAGTFYRREGELRIRTMLTATRTTMGRLYNLIDRINFAKKIVRR